MIDAGKLDRVLNVMVATTTTDALGQEVSDFTPLVTIRGQGLEMRTQDAARAGGRETFAMARYLIRYRPELTTAMRVHTGGRIFDIVQIEEPDRNRSLIITLDEVTHQ